MNLKSSFALLGLCATLACGGGSGGSSNSYTPPPPSGPPPNTVYVGGDNGYGGASLVFSPATLTVSAGTQVSFIWQGGMTHSVDSYSLASDSSSKTFTSSGDLSSSNTTYQVTLSTAGTYYYYCKYHGNFFGTYPNATSVATGMAGKIIVQ